MNNPVILIQWNTDTQTAKADFSKITKPTEILYINNFIENLIVDNFIY